MSHRSHIATQPPGFTTPSPQPCLSHSLLTAYGLWGDRSRFALTVTVCDWQPANDGRRCLLTAQRSRLDPQRAQPGSGSRQEPEIPVHRRKHRRYLLGEHAMVDVVSAPILRHARSSGPAAPIADRVEDSTFPNQLRARDWW